jgi:hypothetical protein
VSRGPSWRWSAVAVAQEPSSQPWRWACWRRIYEPQAAETLR